MFDHLVKAMDELWYALPTSSAWAASRLRMTTAPSELELACDQTQLRAIVARQPDRFGLREIKERPPHS